MPRPVDIKINQTGDALSGIRSISGALAGLGTAAIAASAVAVGALAAIGISAIKQGLEFNATLEQMQVSFNTFAEQLLGPTATLEEINALGEDMMDWVKEISITTPFEAMDLATNLRRLLAMGLPLEQAKDLLLDIGDATAAMGGSAEMFDSIARSFAQISAKGKVSTEELMQLAEAGIPAFQILQEHLGVTREELDKMLRDGLIPSTVGIDALSTAIEDRFGGAMAEQSLTMSGLLSSLSDFKNFLLADITAPLFEELKPLLNELMVIAQSPEFKEFATMLGLKLAETFEAALPVLREMVNEILPSMELALPILLDAWDGLIVLLKSPEFKDTMKFIAEVLGLIILGMAGVAKIITTQTLPALFQLSTIIRFHFLNLLAWLNNEFLPKFKKLGTDIINGIKQGLNGSWGELLQLAYNIANSIKNTIASALQIQSPSKVMEKLGEQTVEGFKVGMEKSSGQMLNQESKFMPTININNPSVRSDADIKGIAQQVMFEMKKMNNTYRGGFSTGTV